MSQILSVGTANPPYVLEQSQAMTFAHDLFSESFSDIERLLKIFNNGQIDRRYFSAPLDWYKEEHSLKEKNDLYCEMAIGLGCQAINACIGNETFMNEPVSTEDIDAFLFISSTGMSTPSIDAKIMNRLSFNPHTKRIPIWGLGCAGGAAGLARAYEYCKAFPEESVIVLCVELCSLTFQHSDRSKSNLVGTSLFADGTACVLVTGDRSPLRKKSGLLAIPTIIDAQSTLMPQSEDVMGWDIRDKGLYVVFAKSIPKIVEAWFKPNVIAFLGRHGHNAEDIDHFIAHPGGRKVLEAYEKALNLDSDMTDDARAILRGFGNMSSPTVLYVLSKIMTKKPQAGETGLAVSLGPGFSSEQVLIKWEDAI